MSPLIETIRIEHGVAGNLEGHQSRLARSWKALGGSGTLPDLAAYLKNLQIPQHGLYKCRVVYADRIMNVEFTPYTPRPVETVRLVRHDTIGYAHKFLDRRTLGELFSRRDGCDDVLIIRGGLVTDCSYANIIFNTGNEWVTPESYLLPGVERACLLGRKMITERKILEEDLPTFVSFRLINSMLLDQSPEQPVANLKGIEINTKK